jgi:hypothetical protein
MPILGEDTSVVKIQAHIDLVNPRPVKWRRARTLRSSGCFDPFDQLCKFLWFFFKWTTVTVHVTGTYSWKISLCRKTEM